MITTREREAGAQLAFVLVLVYTLAALNQVVNTEPGEGYAVRSVVMSSFQAEKRTLFSLKTSLP